MAITNSAEIFEAHFPKIKPAKVIVEYGKPIYPDQLSKEDKKTSGGVYTGNYFEYAEETQGRLLKVKFYSLYCSLS